MSSHKTYRRVRDQVGLAGLREELRDIKSELKKIRQEQRDSAGSDPEPEDE